MLANHPTHLSLCLHSLFQTRLVLSLSLSPTLSLVSPLPSPPTLSPYPLSPPPLYFWVSDCRVFKVQPFLCSAPSHKGGGQCSVFCSLISGGQDTDGVGSYRGGRVCVCVCVCVGMFGLGGGSGMKRIPTYQAVLMAMAWWAEQCQLAHTGW